MTFRELIIEVKALDVPLTGSEIKKLEALEKRMKAGKALKRGMTKMLGRDALGKDRDLYDNLLARSTVHQKTYELKTIAQIAKSNHVSSALQVIARIAKGRGTQGQLRYLDKTEKLTPENEEAFLKEYEDTIKKMYKSPAYRKLAIKTLEQDVEDNNFNDRIPNKIKKWALNIIAKSKEPSDIVFFDGYKLYQYLEIKDWDEDWVSSQGAIMTAKKASVTFVYDKDYTKEFHLSTYGYWNS